MGMRPIEVDTSACLGCGQPIEMDSTVYYPRSRTFRVPSGLTDEELRAYIEREASKPARVYHSACAPEDASRQKP